MIMLIIQFFFNFTIFVKFQFLVKAHKVHKLVLQVKTYNLCEFEPLVEIMWPQIRGWTEIGNCVRGIGYGGF